MTKFKFTQERIQALLPLWTDEEYDPEYGYDISLCFGEAKELVRLALLGWNLENAKSVSHLKHCNGDERFCDKPHLHK